MLKVVFLIIWLNGYPLDLELFSEDHCEKMALKIKQAHRIPDAIHVCIPKQP